MDGIGGGFGDLLRDAEQLTADVDTGNELPRVDQTLHQIMETSQRTLDQDSTARSLRRC